jgi:hypothetical protein
MSLYPVYLAALFVSTVLAFVYYSSLASRQLAIFAPYLALVCIQEVLIYQFLIQHPDRSTAIVYNIYRPLSTCFFAFLFYRNPINKTFRKLIIILVLIYLFATIFTFTLLQSIQKYNNYLYLSGGLVITSCAVFFLFNYFKLDNYSEERKWLPVLWISVGIVIFYPVVNISFALYNHLKATNGTVSNVKVYQLIPRIMSIFMYSCFGWAFYLCRKKNWT